MTGVQTCALPISNVDRRELINKDWKSVNELSKNDLIGIVINQNNVLPTLSTIDTNNLDFWWCIGRWFGDGWITHTVRKSGIKKGQKIKDVIICCNKNNQETNDILKKTKSWVDIRISEDVTTNKIYLKNKELYDWLQQFGHGASNKHFTQLIFDLPVKQLKALLEGYFSADGYYTSSIYGAQANYYEQSFGLVAMIALTPIIAIQVLGVVEKIKEERARDIMRKHIYTEEDAQIIHF